ncbi:MAG: DNA polymerase III subunit delta [Breznakibacter sp.]
MTFEQIMSSLQKREFKPIYFLMGEESWFIDQITDYIAQNVLSDAEKGFNQTVLYGKDTNAAHIIMAARRYPMMSPHQVIIVKEAQNVADIDKLEIYAQNPLLTTILVVNYRYKTIDKRKKLAKLVEEKGVLFESKKLYDNNLPSWITNYVKNKGKTIDPKAAVVMAESVGSDLSKLVHEIEKLIVAVGPQITNLLPDHVEKNIGISKDFNNFELQKAIAAKNVYKVNQIIFAFGKNPKDNPIQITTVTLFNFFVKLLMYHYLPDKSKNNVASVLKVNPYFVDDYVAAARNFSGNKTVKAISLLREYDMKSKGFESANTDSAELLKELVFKIMN